MKKGFTLSEILITLGIIGIIAVLTIPGVVKNYKNLVYATQLKKTNAQISNALYTAITDEHSINFAESKISMKNTCENADEGICSEGAGYFLNNYFKVIKKNCKTGTNKCLADKYTSIDGQDAGEFFGEYCAQISSGATICIEYNSGNDTQNLAIDINGPAEPNMTGRDVFVAVIDNEGQIQDWGPADSCNVKNTYNHIAKYAVGCLKNVKDHSWKITY